MRLILAIWLGKLIFFLTRFIKTGGGSAAPGLYALKICPSLIKSLTSQIPQNVVITGTNGKTTTARLLAHFLKPQNIKVIRNSTGSNLARGIASSLIAHSDWMGRVKADLGVWETDEAAFNSVVFDLKPQVIVFLNAFRDQLDRYGEVDSVVKKWHRSLEKIEWKAKLVINKNDPNTAGLVTASKENPLLTTTTFSVKNHFMTHEIVSGKNKTKRFKSDFEAEWFENLGLKGSVFIFRHPIGRQKISLNIPGVYHIYDFLAAFAAYYYCQPNLPINDIPKIIQSFSPAFGRVEQIKIGNREGYIFLIKNPTGATEVFQTIAPELKNGDRLLIALNDNFADGKDVSWIWDAGFETLVKSSNQPKLQIYCSGSRAQDLALRLKYAGTDHIYLKVEPELSRALLEAQEGLSGRLFILPTYTALLELQGLLAKQGLKKHYWKES